MASELPFTLLQNESIIKDIWKVIQLSSSLQKAGTKYVKTEDNVAKGCHLFLTDKRLIFVSSKYSGWGKKNEQLGVPFDEISLKDIEGIVKTDHTLPVICTKIQIASRNSDGEIDKKSIMFTKGKHANKNGEIIDLNKFTQLLIQTKELAQNDHMEIKKPGVDSDPWKILQIRYANGEISREEFLEMKRDLNL